MVLMDMVTGFLGSDGKLVRNCYGQVYVIPFFGVEDMQIKDLLHSRI